MQGPGVAQAVTLRGIEEILDDFSADARPSIPMFRLHTTP